MSAFRLVTAMTLVGLGAATLEERLTFRSEVDLLNGTLSYEAANDVFTSDIGRTMKNCEINIDKTLDLEVTPVECPVIANDTVTTLNATSKSELEFFLMGLHPSLYFSDSRKGTISTRQAIWSSETFNLSVAVTNMCGYYVPVTVLIRVKCSRQPTHNLPLLLTETEKTLSVRGNNIKPVCPAKLIHPANGLFNVKCVNFSTDVYYVPPGHVIGRLIMDGPGNYSFTQTKSSNFEVYENGTVALGGYVIGDGFEGTFQVNITDISFVNLSNISCVLDIEVFVNCFANRKRTQTTARTTDHNVGTETADNPRLFRAANVASTTAAALDGVLLWPSERADSTPSLTEAARYVGGIPPGADL